MRTIVLFRNDLRVADNPALTWAAKHGDVLPVFLYNPELYGGAAKWWLHHSLARLCQKLGRLLIAEGVALDTLRDVIAAFDIDAVAWNRRYEPEGIKEDTELKAALKDDGIEAQSFQGNLLYEPWQIRTGSGGPFKVFGPFWRACLKTESVPVPLAAPKVTCIQGERLRLDDLNLLPQSPNWALAFETEWEPGEAGAHARLSAFFEDGLLGYKEGRDRPDQAHVSRLSPHLHFGEISPRQVWHATQRHMAVENGVQLHGDKFLAELGWREFSHHLLFHFPSLPRDNLNLNFNAYPWAEDQQSLQAWQKGQTGYPLVDAGMRELWATGYMHNRVRMVVASFLIKHLRLHWHHGADWFWDTLLDADLANNSASWQWVAGCGADAAPYFRIFNPTTQAEKFDPEGVYIRKWCPELKLLPNKVIHAPFDAPALVLREAGVSLGETYPLPIVDHKAARAAALAGYEAVKAAKRADLIDDVGVSQSTCIAG